MYLEAAKVQEELQKLKAQRHSQNTTYWVERHDRTIASLRGQRESLFSVAQQRMDGLLRRAESKVKRDRSEMKKRHVSELTVLRKSIERSEAERNRTSRPGSPSQKFSGKVLALLEKEKRLARGRFYERAARARKDAEKLMAGENEERKLNDFRLRQGKMSRLVMQHKEEELALQSNFEHNRRKLVAECREGQSLITVRVRKARSDLSRARSLRVAMATSSSPVLSDAAIKASIKGESSAANLPLAVSLSGKSSPSQRAASSRPKSAHPLTRSITGGSGGGSGSGSGGSGGDDDRHRRRARPSTAPSTRRSNSRAVPRSSETETMLQPPSYHEMAVEVVDQVLSPKSNETREEREDDELMIENDDDYNDDDVDARLDDVEELDDTKFRRRERARSGRSGRRAQSAGRRRRPASGGGRPSFRGGGKIKSRRERKKKSKPCWWCGECDGHIAKSGVGVAVPSASNPVKGTGNFCSWECASCYVFKYFPPQDRWLSDLLIQDTAGYLVRKSKRPHRRPQGPGIPSIGI